MIGAARGAVLSATNPLLDLFTLIPQTGAPSYPLARWLTLAAPFSASYAIFDVSTDDKLLSPVQVFPGSGTQPVDLMNDLIPDAPDGGHYAANWTVPSGEALGKHEIRWTVVPAAGAQPVIVREEFDVGIGYLGGAFAAYALPSDVRDEGVDSATSDVRIQRALMRASARIELLTRRHFEPRLRTFSLDGTNNRALRFDVPVMAITSIRYEDGTLNVDPLNLRVYNRWLSENLLSPDDRADPRIEWMNWERPFIWRFIKEPTAIWYEGRKNVVVAGLFGYTEPDGTFTGATPDRIRELCKALAIRELPGIVSDPEDRFDLRARHRITQETTRDQSYVMSPDNRMAEFTGDPELDEIICEFMAPPFIGST